MAYREAINRLYEAVPGVKGIWKKKVSFHPVCPCLCSFLGQGAEGACLVHGAELGVSWGNPFSSFSPGSLDPMGCITPMVVSPCQAPNKALVSILGKSNLRFAGMSIAVNISVDGLNLMIPTTRQVRTVPRAVALPPPSPLPPTGELSAPL